MNPLENPLKMKTSITLLFISGFLSLAVHLSQLNAQSNQFRDESFLIYFWFFGDNLPDNTPLETVTPSFARLPGSQLTFHSALPGYPYHPFHPLWRQASMEKIQDPTPINYIPEGNDEIPFEDSQMSGIKIKPPFSSFSGQNILEFSMPVTGFRDVVFAFAARNAGAAGQIIVEYAVNEGTPQWITTGLFVNTFPLNDDYQKFLISFTAADTQIPPNPPMHGSTSAQILQATTVLVDNNPHFRLRIRFSGFNPSAGMENFVAFNNFSLTGRVTAPNYHVIQVPSGWSGISSYVVPDQSLLETLFYPFTNRLVLLQNFTGLYWPAQGINTLFHWSSQQGYTIRTSKPLNLLLAGEQLSIPQVQLQSGWNYLPVTIPCATPIVELFVPVVNKLVLVKEIAGHRVYWPALGINSLQYVYPGKSYLVLMQSSANIYYPPCNFDQTDLSLKVYRFSPQIDSGFHALRLNPTSVSHLIAFAFEDQEAVAEGSLVVATDAQGKIFGAGKVAQNLSVIALYGDDPTTSVKDGFLERESVFFKLMNPDQQIISHLQPIFDQSFTDAKSHFVPHGVSRVTFRYFHHPGTSSEECRLLYDFYPNPALDAIQILLEDIPEVPIRFYIRNMVGEIVYSGCITDVHTRVDLGSINPGIYFVQLIQGTTSCVKRLVKM